LIKEESSEPSELSEDKFAESTEVEVDNMDEQEELVFMKRNYQWPRWGLSGSVVVHVLSNRHLVHVHLSI